MESKILNFPKAMRVASILKKYVDVSKVSPEQIALEFIEIIISGISPRDYSDILEIFTGESIVTINEKTKGNGKSILELLFSGLEKNRIISLLDAYSRIGFV